METFSFHEGVLPSDYQPGFEISLYNKSAHLLLQASGGWQSFYVLNRKHNRVEASIFFQINNEGAFSPWRAPFGSVEYSDKISPETLYRFLEYVESRLRAWLVKKIIIKNPPQHYSPAQSVLLEVFLFNLGYQVIEAEVSTILSVNDESLFIDSWEKRKLRQSREANLEFRKLSIEHLDELYLFILGCRKQKKYSLSMTLADVRKTAEQFPDRYLLFGVFQDDKLVAGSIAVQVTRDVLYNFYCDHDNHYDHLSPVVFLIEGMCHYCEQQNISSLDLGTSAIDGKPNFGLLDFKMRLRGQPATKLTFQKIID